MTEPSEHARRAAEWAQDNGLGFVARELLERFASHVIDAATAEWKAEWAWIEKHRPLIERQAIGQWRVCTAKGCYEADTLREAITAARNEQECK